MGSFSGFEPTALDHGEDVLYTIAKSETIGRHMVAVRDIKQGEVIFKDEPACIGKCFEIPLFLYKLFYFISIRAGPDNSSKPMCLGCHKKLPVGSSYTCPLCHWPMCGKECCSKPLHKQECNFFSKHGTNIFVPWFDKPCFYYDAILPIRILLLKGSNPKIYKYEITSVSADSKSTHFFFLQIGLSFDGPQRYHR